MTEPEPGGEPTYKPSLKLTLKRGFRDIYDRLGAVLVASFGLFAAFAVPVSAGYRVGEIGQDGGAVLGTMAGALAGCFLAAPLWAGICVWARNVASYNDPSLADLSEGFRRWLVPSWKLAFADLGMAALIAVNLYFYARFPAPWARLVLILWLYAALFGLTSMMYHFPLLIEQKAGVLKIWKRSALLALDNLPFTFALFFVILIFAGAFLMTRPGWVFLMVLEAGTVSLLTTHGFRELFRKYGLIPPEPDKPAEDRWKGIPPGA